MFAAEMESAKKRMGDMEHDAFEKISKVRKREKRINKLRRLSGEDLTDLSSQISELIAHGERMTMKADTYFQEWVKLESLNWKLEKSFEEFSQIKKDLLECVEFEKLEKQDLLLQLDDIRKRHAIEQARERRKQSELEDKLKSLEYDMQKDSSKIRLAELEAEISQLRDGKLELEYQLSAASEKNEELEVRLSRQPAAIHQQPTVESSQRNEKMEVKVNDIFGGLCEGECRHQCEYSLEKLHHDDIDTPL